MDLLGLEEALGELRPLSAEISVRSWCREAAYETGLIAFQPRSDGDPRQILHDDRDVVCHVLRGEGRLRLDDQTVPVAPGLLCRIPAGTPHDFAATAAEPLVLFYTLIRVSPS
jgi:mannose-6-phosphate isomerase-like protein (cupin superfamily)